MEMKPKKEDDDSEFKSRISRENTKSRRYSASYIRSFREDTKSFRSNVTISSTASSPGYPFKDEIDPSTYSFTTALKALQARSGYRNLEWLYPDGFALNSKWNEAEKYICNPVSGEVPMECLSAKTLSGRSFTSSNRITMSAPLLYSSTQIQSNPSNFAYTQQDLPLQFHIPEKKYEGMRKDAATQSSPHYLSSSNTSSSVLTPSIIDTSMKLSQDSTHSNSKTKSHEEEEEVKEKERWETRKETTSKTENNEWTKKDNQQLCRESGCFPWITNKRHTDKQRQRKTNIFLIHFNIC